MENREARLERSGEETEQSADEYEFHYRDRASFLKNEITSLLKKIDSTAEKGNKG